MNDKLREDFPIDWGEDQYVSRREFLRFLTLASGGLVVGSAALAVSASNRGEQIAFEPLRVCSLDDVPAGTSLGFRYPRKQDICILVHRPTGELAAFSRRCTHLSCPVNYEPEKERLYCPCHNGAFSLDDGSVLQGPPPHPLPRIMVEVREGQVWAVGVKRAE